MQASACDILGYTFGKGSSKGKKVRAILAGTTGGGLIGNTVVKEQEKSKEQTSANKHVVKLTNGKDATITTEQGRIDVGDCVAIARGESVRSACRA